MLGIMHVIMEIKTIADLEKCISDGPYSNLGRYPKYFVTSDRGILSFNSVVRNLELIKDSINGSADVSGWRVCACYINWEILLYCDHSGEQIESAYEPID